MSLKLTVDNSGEIFGDKTSIADLAQFSFNGEDSERMHIYHADQILRRDWRNEIDKLDMEYATGVSAKFKDGSQLHVGAWADCCREGDADHGNCHWCGGRY